jgi:hypothetical protein
MPFGDSVTYGWQHEDDLGLRGESDGYRNPLWWNFAAQHMLVDFIGPDDSGSLKLPSPDHAGYPGERAISSRYRAWDMMQMLPDIRADGIRLPSCLWPAPTMSRRRPRRRTPSARRSATSSTPSIRRSPLIHVYVATLPPISPSTLIRRRSVSVNAAITLTVQQAIAEGLNVSLVSMSNLTLADLYDGKHPSEAGYAKMAQNWFNAILATQPADGGTPGGNCACHRCRGARRGTAVPSMICSSAIPARTA